MGLATWQGSGCGRSRGAECVYVYVPVQRHGHLLPLWFKLEIIQAAEMVVWPWCLAMRPGSDSSLHPSGFQCNIWRVLSSTGILAGPTTPREKLMKLTRMLCTCAELCLGTMFSQAG